mmetsp:Transcript_50526/g.163596  ORF Transcript_50526/g.163596 Transcript_50526/m.163596 type:complete len:205 (+) Transcript_50526:62-676(+)
MQTALLRGPYIEIPPSSWASPRHSATGGCRSRLPLPKSAVLLRGNLQHHFLVSHFLAFSICSASSCLARAFRACFCLPVRVLDHCFFMPSFSPLYFRNRASVCSRSISFWSFCAMTTGPGFDADPPATEAPPSASKMASRMLMTRAAPECSASCSAPHRNQSFDRFEPTRGAVLGAFSSADLGALGSGLPSTSTASRTLARASS